MECVVRLPATYGPDHLYVDVEQAKYATDADVAGVRAEQDQGMNTHPDVMWELVRDRQARLRQEAETYNRAGRLQRAIRSRARWAS
jgi:hypothetical protein